MKDVKQATLLKFEIIVDEYSNLVIQTEYIQPTRLAKALSGGPDIITGNTLAMVLRETLAGLSIIEDRINGVLK